MGQPQAGNWFNAHRDPKGQIVYAENIDGTVNTAGLNFPDGSSISFGKITGLFLSGTSVDFALANSITSNVILAPSSGRAGSGGLFAGLSQHADVDPTLGYGVLVLMFGQVDNTAGGSPIAIPTGGLGLINVPAAFTLLQSPSSIVTAIPAGGTAQVAINQYMFVPATAVPPSSLGNVKLMLTGAQTARLQLSGFAIAVPLIWGLNPTGMSPVVTGICE